MKRIEFLDGLRGIAILLVIIFHAFSRWPTIVPYGNTYGEFPLFEYGYLGVQLFFLISGFVILMSLEKSSSFFNFIYKRWLRLFPTMLIATILIYATAHFLYERPAGIPNIYSVIPGLIFTEPSWVKAITGIPINRLEGSFWSLYVEFKFYFIFGLTYFIWGGKKAIAVIFSMYLVYVIADEFNIRLLTVLSNAFSFKFFSWFASGSLAYLYFGSKNLKYLYLSILVGVVEVFRYQYDITLMLYSMVILLVFFIPVYFEKSRFLIGNKVLLFLGFISYPLYLIHENAMIALICKIHKFVDMPLILLPVISITIIIFISYLIVKIAEPFVHRLIVQVVANVNDKFVKWRAKDK